MLRANNVIVCTPLMAVCVMSKQKDRKQQSQYGLSDGQGEKNGTLIPGIRFYMDLAVLSE